MIYALPPVIPHVIVITANQADCKRGSRDCFPRDRSGWRSPTHGHDQSSAAVGDVNGLLPAVQGGQPTALAQL